MKKAIVISLVTLLVNIGGVFVFAQTPSPATEKNFPAAYDAFVGKTIAVFPDLPGMAIVVIKDDKPIFIRAYGMADKEAGIKADTDTLWYIASSTKAFTALAAATIFSDEGYGKYAYTNLGYNVYGLLLQNALNTKWQDLLQKRVFDPAGL